MQESTFNANGTDPQKSQTSIIVTKLNIPAVGMQRVIRHRLLQALEQGLQRKLTLLSAPAGYGKTTLLSDWAAMLEMPVGWVSLDRGDEDRIRFWSHTIAALARAYPAFQAQRVWQIAYTDMAGESLIAALLNELHRLSETVVLVWDDFHFITEQRVLSEVDYFLQRLPQHVHVYMASRTVPPLGIPRMRARGELVELGMDMLRLTLEETADLLSRYEELSLTADEAAEVYRQTEGWAAGVCLAALSYGRHGRFSWTGQAKGTDRNVAAYFFDEVFSQLPDALQRFLLYTSILERMDAALCEAVTAEASAADMLQTLERMNLFIVPLDGAQEWYRYHHQFQQFLLSQLRQRESERIPGLHHAAGCCLERHGLLAEAVEQFLASQDFERALALVEKLAPALMDGEWTTLHSWLNRIPDRLLIQKPMLVLAQVGALYLSGRIDDATEKYWWLDRQLDHIPNISPEEKQTVLAGMNNMVAFRGYLEKDFDTFIEYSDKFLQLRPDGDLLTGFGWGPDGYHRVWDIFVSNHGLRQAEEKLAAMWRLWGDKKNENFLAHLCLDYGKLLYERNCLNDAGSFVQRAFDIAVSVRNPHLSVDAAIDLVRIYTAKGWTERAEQLIASVESWYGNDRYPVLAEKLRWFRVERDKREGKLTPATLAESECRLRYNDELPPAMLEQYDLLACLLAVQGRVAEAALLTERLLLLARREGRHRDTIRLLIHKSLFLAQQGDWAHGLETLEEALREAEPDHYIRTFVDEGMPLMQLLKTYVQMRQGKRRRGVGSISLAYVQQILHVMDRQMTDITAMEGVHLVLTPREQATLQLISRGMSNRDIAVQLKISLPTVKTHINHLYRKLQVNNRSDAVRRARFYNLI